MRITRKHKIICQRVVHGTNCLAPVVKVRTRNSHSQGIDDTIHSYTNDQNVLDFPHKDLRAGARGGHHMDSNDDWGCQGHRAGDAGVEGKLDGYSCACRRPTFPWWTCGDTRQKTLPPRK